MSEKRDFYRKVFALVIPMAIQNLINVGVQATDVVMLGKVSEQVLSGCSLGGQVFFIFNLFLFGVSSGVSVLTAQYWGKRDTDSIEKLTGIVMRLAVIVGLIFMLGSFLFPQYLMLIFTNEPEVIAEGVKYLKIVAFTYPMDFNNCIWMFSCIKLYHQCNSDLWTVWSAQTGDCRCGHRYTCGQDAGTCHHAVLRLF